MNTLSGYDSDENDIFVVRRLKPVGRLTKQKALEIKKRVLDKESISKTGIDSCANELEIKDCVKTSSQITNQKREVLDDGDISILEEKINKSVGCVGGSIVKQDKTPDKNDTTPEKSPQKLISSYFTPMKRLSVDKTESPHDKGSSPLSDTEDNKRKRLKHDTIIAGTSAKSPEKTRKIDWSTNLNISPKSHDVDGSVLGNREPQMLWTRFYCSKSLKTIMHHEIVKQAQLEKKTISEGKSFRRLISESEYGDIENLFQLPQNVFELFARMLCRKKGWHRIYAINYEHIDGKVDDMLNVLNAKNFVDFDVHKESMETQLNLLSRSEVQILCKAFNIKVTGTNNKKSDFVNAIMKNGKTQRGITDMWRKDCPSVREQLLKNEIIKMLGPCMKLNESFLSLLNRILLLFCLSHYVLEEQTWKAQIFMMSEMYMRNVSYPSYEIKSTVIFDNRDDFICYVNAMDLMVRCNEALISKNSEEFRAIGWEAKKEFKKLLEDEGFRERIRNLPSFLRKFNAGSVYARILTLYCEKYRKIKDLAEIVEIMEMLINQDTFLVSKKGTWYNLLVQAYADLGKTSEAGKTVLAALRGDSVNDVEKLRLQQRGGLLLKKKKNGLTKGELRDELDDICTVDLTEPSKIEIKARAMDKGESGYKSVYMHKDKAGALTFSSVEETVINHYKANGFPQGIHAEGFIIQTMYFLVFFDVIYKLSPVGVFQSPYQTQPLDFFSRSFYLNRKSEIDSRLKDMRSWSIQEFEDVITKVYTENFGVRCVIIWRDRYTPKFFCEILMCLGIKQFTSICERLVHNFKEYRSGFPDLTVWNPTTRKCKFVEVKSPNDKLSPNQRLWLDFLKKLNIDCEVCNVKNIASRSIRS